MGVGEKEKIIEQIRRELADFELDFDFDEIIKRQRGNIEAKQSIKDYSLKLITANNRQILSFVVLAFLIFTLVPSVAFMNKSIALKKDLENTGMSAYKNLVSAQNSIFSSRFTNAKISFRDAYKNFLEAESETQKMGGIILAVFSNLPGFKKVSAGENLLVAGKYLSSAGIEISKSLEDISRVFSNSNFISANGVSDDVLKLNSGILIEDIKITDILKSSSNNLIAANRNLISAKIYFDKIKVDSLPEDFRNPVLSLKERLPYVIEALDNIEYYLNIFTKILGSDNPRKYLLLFQNPGEIRATGGFVGSYGLVDVFEGKIKNILVDDIFNPDGQLKEKVIPPGPIKRVSTAWSMHDANWFFDFPTSAKKVSWFYEKTGGPTPDGIVSITTNFIEEILKIIGPIDMPDYGVAITADNFVEEVQKEVETGYNKELNMPKKILKDFMPKLIERIIDLDKNNGVKIFNVILNSLESKDLMFYSSFNEIQDLIISEGWGGKITDAEQDYLAVIHSNLNGFKTDRVIEEKISHVSEIDSDGNIVNTVTMRRFHNGGNYKYDYWNKVNTDYLRFYVPNGSQLVYARGFTEDRVSDPIDYQKNNFKIDGDVLKIEQTLRHNKEFGMDIFEETGKTVFGGWVFLSPKETVVVEVKYVLPFKFDFKSGTRSHSIFVQKQPGLKDIDFESIIKFPDFQKVVWNYPSNLKINKEGISFSAKLNKDYFYGVVLDRASDKD